MTTVEEFYQVGTGSCFFMLRSASLETLTMVHKQLGWSFRPKDYFPAKKHIKKGIFLQFFCQINVGINLDIR